ncbi:MAG: PHP domain-containing protein [Veillonellaceae bacterium]|nr:PHP domain-containing protein [Veillonellaceae bacterium]
MRRFVADLHVHSLLSPCAAIEMTPRNIVNYAIEHNIDIIAITDHNACDNVPAAVEAAAGTNVTVIPGMEIETKEEVHLITLFETVAQLKSFNDYVVNHLSGRLNDQGRFGAQIIVDAYDEFLGCRKEMLLASLTCGVEEVTAEAAARNGICIASHVDRPVYSILSQLGFVPPDSLLAAVEVSRLTSIQSAAEKFPGIGGLPVITSSDAHFISDFITGPKTVFFMEKPTLLEISLALNNQNGRKVLS